MKFAWLKYLLVFVCIFSILESTGVSVISIFKKASICQTDCSLVNDDDDAAEKTENKENNLKEFWSVNPDLSLPQFHLHVKVIDYPDEKSNHHLAWVPPVPTPPPNYTI